MVLSKLIRVQLNRRLRRRRRRRRHASLFSAEIGFRVTARGEPARSARPGPKRTVWSTAPPSIRRRLFWPIEGSGVRLMTDRRLGRCYTGALAAQMFATCRPTRYMLALVRRSI